MNNELFENIIKETCREKISEAKIFDIDDLDDWDKDIKEEKTEMYVLNKTKSFCNKTFDKLVDYEIKWQKYCCKHPVSAAIMAITSFGLGLVLRYYICKALRRDFITFKKEV